MNEEPFVWSGPLLSLFRQINYRYRYWHLILFDHLGAGCALDATTRGLKTAMVELGRAGLEICAWFLVLCKSFYYVPVFQIRIQSGQWIRIQQSKNDFQKKFYVLCLCFEVLDVLFLMAEGFSCSLDVLYGGLGISKLFFFLIKKISYSFFSCKFFPFLVIKTQYPNWFSAYNSGSGSGISESGSETLLCYVPVL